MSDSRSRTDDSDESGNRAVATAGLSRRRLLAAATVTGSGLAGRVVAGASETSGVTAGPGSTENSWARDRVWVETNVDTNGTGRNDRIFVRVTRPEETEAGTQVPVIATASPYYGEHDHGDTTAEMLFDRSVELSGTDRRGAGATGGEDGVVGDARGATGSGDDTEPGAVPESRPHRARRFAGRAARPNRQERRYVAQGYAVARISSLGTHESTGCYTGAGPETAEALKAVVDWFNGRATAYDAKRGGAPVAADWTDGTTAMIGTSAEGELANAVATTGVDGLEAIVPNAANNGQYSLFRANGTPVSITPQTTDRMAELSSWMEATNVARPDCDHWAERTVKRQDYRTGDYNDFWHDREFLARADSVEAAVLLSQGLSDPIVKPNNTVDWYETLDAADVPVKLWLHQGDHRDPDSNAWSDLLDRWLAYWLKGEDNGVMDEEPVTVEHSHEMDDEGPVDTYDAWPVPDAGPTPVGFAPDGTTVGTVTATNDGGATTTESFVDDAATAAADLVEASESANRLRYESPPLGRPLRLSGRVVPDLALSFDEPTVVSVALVAYEPDVARILTRGWVDPLNRPRYTDYDSPVAYKQSLRSSAPIDEGERVRVEFPLQAVDTVAPEGSRIGLVVYGADERFTVHPPGDSTVSLSLADSEVSLPVIGGTAALTEAFAEPPSGHTETPTPNSTPTEETARTEPTRTDGEPTDSPTGMTTEDTPGFGFGIASTVLGGIGYLLARGRGGEESPADD